MGRGKVIGEALGKLRGFGKKVAANLPVDGGIQGLSREIIEKEKNNIVRAKAAMEQVVSSGSDATIKAGNLKKASDLSGFKVKKGTPIDESALLRHIGDREAALNGADLTNATKAYRDITGKDVVKTTAAQVAQYYTGGSLAQNASRIGVSAGAWVGASAMGRGLASYGVNSKGERDIAGLPGF